MIRRGFLEGILGACIAPAFVRPTSLMPLWLPVTEVLTAEEFVRQDLARGIEQFLDRKSLDQFDALAGDFIEMLRPKTILMTNRGKPFNLRVTHANRM